MHDRMVFLFNALIHFNALIYGLMELLYEFREGMPYTVSESGEARPADASISERLVRRM